jgi:hypothetical protein
MSAVTEKMHEASLQNGVNHRSSVPVARQQVAARTTVIREGSYSTFVSIVSDTPIVRGVNGAADQSSHRKIQEVSADHNDLGVPLRDVDTSTVQQPTEQSIPDHVSDALGAVAPVAEAQPGVGVQPSKYGDIFSEDSLRNIAENIILKVKRFQSPEGIRDFILTSIKMPGLLPHLFMCLREIERDTVLENMFKMLQQKLTKDDLVVIDEIDLRGILF